MNCEQFAILTFCRRANRLREAGRCGNGLYGLVPRYGSIPDGSIPVDFVERVEVLKGPSALLNGMSPNGAVGGAINLIPKRAGNDPLTRVTTGLDSNTLWNTHLDISRRFGQNHEWGIRFNGNIQDGGTAIDGQSKRGNNATSLALDYHGPRLRLALDIYRLEDKNRGGTSLAVSTATGLVSMPRAPDGSTNAAPWVNYNARTEAGTLSGEYDITDSITAYGKFGIRHYGYTGYQLSSVYNLQADGAASAIVMNIPWESFGTSGEAGLRGTFQTGAVRHNLVLSGSRIEDNVKDASSYITTNINIYHPVFSGLLPPAPGEPRKISDTILTGVALADTLSMANNRVLLTAGVRYQDVSADNFSTSGAVTSSYGKSAVTPMAGLVIKPLDYLSLYGNYIEGLSQGTIVSGSYQNAGEVFPPFKTTQIEFGAKLETGRIINTLSFFQIEKPSTLVDYGTSPLPTFRLNGEQRNRGIEWNIFGEITPRLRVLGGVTYMQGTLTKTQGGTQNGNSAPGVAPWATNLGIEWDTPWLSGLTLSGRVINTSSQYLDSANAIQLPNWTRVDIAARYIIKFWHTPVTFRGAIHNLLGSNYWEGIASSGTATLAAPRLFMLSATADF